MLGYALPYFLYGFANKGINLNVLQAFVVLEAFAWNVNLSSLPVKSQIIPNVMRTKSLVYCFLAFACGASASPESNSTSRTRRAVSNSQNIKSKEFYGLNVIKYNGENGEIFSISQKDLQTLQGQSLRLLGKPVPVQFKSSANIKNPFINSYNHQFPSGNIKNIYLEPPSSPWPPSSQQKLSSKP